MNQTKILVVALTLALAPAAHPALKPTDGVITPQDYKSVLVFKTTAQGDLKMNLYFPKDWKSSDHRPAIGAEHGLLPLLKIEDFQADGTQGDLARFPDVLLVRAAVRYRPGDVPDPGRIGRAVPMRKPRNATHSLSVTPSWAKWKSALR